MKKISAILAVLFLVCSVATGVSAHSSSQKNILRSSLIPEYGNGVYYVGGENVGWSIDESLHTNGPALYYKFSQNLSSARQTIATDAAKKWKACSASLSNVGSSTSVPGVIGTISQASLSNSNIVAQFSGSAGANGHLTNWSIKFNTNCSTSADSATIAHELCHVYGLNDLYSTNDPDNRSRLMFGTTESTATRPSYRDAQGFWVITGKHTTHSFSSSGVCSRCAGIKK